MAQTTLEEKINESTKAKLQELGTKLSKKEREGKQDGMSNNLEVGSSSKSLCNNKHDYRQQAGPLNLASSARIDLAVSQKARALAEIEELQRQKRWKDIVTLAYPLEEKYPLLVEMEMDIELARTVSFALVQCSMHQKAMKLLEQVVQRVPEDYRLTYSVAYAAYDALYLHKNRESILSPREKSQFLELAHKYFKKCCTLKPDNVNAYYRRAMLYKEIEDKPKKAIPLFEQSIRNWERLSADEKESRHYERPKYIKSIYHLAACYLRRSLASKSLSLLEKLVKEDEATNFVSMPFKQFALGKTLFKLCRFKDALNHLQTAKVASQGARPPDYIVELTAGCLLMLNQPEEALREIDTISPKYQRPYVRWRRADILSALGRPKEALSTLEEALDRDGISKHKTLLRIARLRYGLGEYDNALLAAKKATSFYSHRYGNDLKDARFMEAICHLGIGNPHKAKQILESLRREGFSCPGFTKALIETKKACAELEAKSCQKENLIH